MVILFGLAAAALVARRGLKKAPATVA